MLHISPHTPLTQAAVPFGSAGQVMQAVPHAPASLSAAQRALVPVPQRWLPAPQLKSQVPPVQLLLAPVGLGQAVHDVPHDSTLVSDEQMPLQSWVPVGQVTAHGIALSMHVPAHSFIPV